METKLLSQIETKLLTPGYYKLTFNLNEGSWPPKEYGKNPRITVWTRLTKKQKNDFYYPCTDYVVLRPKEPYHYEKFKQTEKFYFTANDRLESKQITKKEYAKIKILVLI